MGEEIVCEGVMHSKNRGTYWRASKECDCKKCVGEFQFRDGKKEGFRQAFVETFSFIGGIMVGVGCLNASYKIAKFGVNTIVKSFCDLSIPL